MHNAYSIYPLSLSKLTQIKCWAMASDQTSQGAQAAQSPATILAIGTANPANFIYQADYPDYYFRVTRSEHMTDLKGKFKRLCKWLMWWKLSISWLSKKCRGACSSYKWMFMIDLSFFFFPAITVTGCFDLTACWSLTIIFMTVRSKQITCMLFSDTSLLGL